jgi:dihydrodipicolinate synthase/N-acetylneuraminate lyase
MSITPFIRYSDALNVEVIGKNPAWSMAIQPGEAMSDNPPSSLTRSEWLQILFPDGVPQLWCPPLTHYTPEGAIDGARIREHLRFLATWVKGLLVPGSTGDGWELSAGERDQLLDLVLITVQELKIRLLVGALRPVTSDTRQAIVGTAQRMGLLPGSDAGPASLSGKRVCGFAVCPPRGAHLSQREIEAELSEVLALGFPIALYQLPQVTQNEMSPELVASLASRFPQLVLFKDTSGRDVVAQSTQDSGGVFLVRGMEGEYARWLKPAGGPYDGFLLSAANYFPHHLRTVIELVEARRLEEARTLSERLDRVISGMFEAVKALPEGNVFANSGKAFDHFFAYGPGAEQAPAPRLHAGSYLPAEVVRTAGALLTAEGLMPSRGYLE